MKIKYVFADGSVSEVEVDEEVGEFILQSRRKEDADDHKQHYHCSYSIDALLYEGDEYGECDAYPSDTDEEYEKQVAVAFAHLSETQQRRMKLYAAGMSLREIAVLENTSFQSIDESIRAARKKFLKFFGKTP